MNDFPGYAAATMFRIIAVLALIVNGKFLQRFQQLGKISEAADSSKAFFSSQKARYAPAVTHVAVSPAFDSMSNVAAATGCVL